MEGGDGDTCNSELEVFPEVGGGQGEDNRYPRPLKEMTHEIQIHPSGGRDKGKLWVCQKADHDQLGNSDKSFLLEPRKTWSIQSAGLQQSLRYSATRGNREPSWTKRGLVLKTITQSSAMQR